MVPNSETAGSNAILSAPPRQCEAQAGQIGALRHIETLSRAKIERCPAWQRAFAAERKDHRYYEIVEDTIRQGFDYRYFALKGEDGEIHAIQPFFINDQDLLAGTGPRAQKLAGFIRRVWPRFLRMRTMMIGCAAGEGHLDAQDEASRFALADSLARALPGEARRLKTKLIVFKEFPATDRPALSYLLDRGFTRIPSMPMTRLRLDFGSFEDYLRNVLSAKMRAQLRRKYRKSERLASLEMRVTTDVTPYLDEIYALYLGVYERSNLHFEKLTPEYFAEIGKNMADKAIFFLWFKDERIVAFSMCMICNNSICSEYIGFDYTLAFDLHLYYIVARDVMKWAISNGYLWYYSTALNYDPKYHLRHELYPLDLYIKHTSIVINLILKRVLGFLEPTRYDKLLQKFPNYDELSAPSSRI